MDIHELEDKAALKELVDAISILGDKKDIDRQILLFSENAVSETIAEGRSILKLQGRKEMSAAFIKFLKDYETIFHFNGQQKVAIHGDHATGECYCFITLIGNEDGKKIKTTIGAIYVDDYTRVGKKWLVSKRVGHFTWQDKTAIKS